MRRLWLVAAAIQICVSVATGESVPKNAGGCFHILRAMGQKYINEHTSDPSPWILAYDPDIGSSAYMKIQELVADADRILSKYAGVDPLAKRVRVSFPKLECSLFRNGKVFLVPLSKRTPKAERGVGRICFIPYPYTVNEKIHFPSSRFWAPQIGGVMLFARGWPDAVWAGVLFHEFGHGVYEAVDHRPSSLLRPNTEAAAELFASEEVDMYDLQFKVQNAATHGAFMNKVSEIARRLPPQRDPCSALCEMKTRDLAALDKILGVGKGACIRESTTPDNVLAVGFAYLDSMKLSEKDLRKARVVLYRTVTNN